MRHLYIYMRIIDDKIDMQARYSLPPAESLQLKWNFFLRFQILFGYDPYFRNLSLPLACWSIWIMFSPWFVGNVVDSPTGQHYYGFVSTWGIFYDGKLHNAHEVFASGFWDIVTFLVSGSSVTYLNVTKSMCTIGFHQKSIFEPM